MHREREREREREAIVSKDGLNLSLFLSRRPTEGEEGVKIWPRHWAPPKKATSVETALCFCSPAARGGREGRRVGSGSCAYRERGRVCSTPLPILAGMAKGRQNSNWMRITRNGRNGKKAGRNLLCILLLSVVQCLFMPFFYYMQYINLHITMHDMLETKIVAFA